MPVTYTTSHEGVEPADLEGFFQGWEKAPTTATHLRILQGSDHVVLARNGREVVGFITAITDGVLTAYIPLLEVKPDYRNQGIGRQLVEQMMEELKEYYSINLTCDPELRAFYTELGMRALTAMAHRNYDFQQGRPEP